MKLIYFTPYPGKRKELFPSFDPGSYKFCPLCREDAAELAEGGGEDIEYPGDDGGEAR